MCALCVSDLCNLPVQRGVILVLELFVKLLKCRSHHGHSRMIDAVHNAKFPMEHSQSAD